MDSQTKDKYKIIKRPRIKYTQQQVERLERVFEENQYPDSNLTEDLAMDLGVSTDRVSIWFQNRRSKFKRQRLPDHLMWMRKQVYQGESGPQTPQLPVLSSACHVLSPLEPQISRRELPVDISSPLTPQARPTQRQTVPRTTSPSLVLQNGFSSYPQHQQTDHLQLATKNVSSEPQTRTHPSMKENHHSHWQKTEVSHLRTANHETTVLQNLPVEENRQSGLSHSGFLISTPVPAIMPTWFGYSAQYHPIMAANLDWNQVMMHTPVRNLHMHLPVNIETENQTTSATSNSMHLSDKIKTENQTTLATHNSMHLSDKDHRTTPVNIETENQPTSATSNSMHLSDKDFRTTPASNFFSIPDILNTKDMAQSFNHHVNSTEMDRNIQETSYPVFQLQRNSEDALYPVSSKLQVQSTPVLQPRQPECAAVTDKDWELEDLLLKQKAIECLELWC